MNDWIFDISLTHNLTQSSLASRLMAPVCPGRLWMKQWQ